MTPSAPTVSLSAQPTAITLGQSATLTWSTTNTSTCTASGAWSGNEPPSGSQSVTPTMPGSLIYTLACTAAADSGTTAKGSATLTVNSASAFTFTTLVSDTAGDGGTTTDSSLVNPWGIVFATGQPVYVVNNGTSTVTAYDGNGKPRPTAKPLVILLPAAPSGTAFGPTGLVANGTADFVVSAAGISAPAAYIFAGEGGMIAAWEARVSGRTALTVYTDSSAAVHKGLALASDGSGNFLYATDFHNNKIDVFDANFVKQPAAATSFTFNDPALPSGYAPFGIQALANGSGGATQLYVTYAKQLSPDNRANLTGAGLGLVNVFDTNGNLAKHLIATGGALDAPWGISLAPADFGTLSNMLLVGNFGDGRIRGYDPASGQLVGSITGAGGAPFAVPGLWGIGFGNDEPDMNQPHNTLFYAAGINREVNGVYGRIDLVE